MTNVMLYYIVPTIHVLSCLFLIVVVLLQTGKGADMGAVFGGGSQTMGQGSVPSRDRLDAVRSALP